MGISVGVYVRSVGGLGTLRKLNFFSGAVRLQMKTAPPQQPFGGERGKSARLHSWGHAPFVRAHLEMSLGTIRPCHGEKSAAIVITILRYSVTTFLAYLLTTNLVFPEQHCV